MSPSRPLSRFTRPLALGLVLFLGASAAQAAAYIKFDGVQGEFPAASLDIGLTGESPVAALLVPAVQKVREAASRMSLGHLACDGAMVARVVIDISEAPGREPYLHYELENVLVSSYSVSVDSSGRPMEQLSLNFERATWSNSETGETFSVVCTSGRCACSP